MWRILFIENPKFSSSELPDNIWFSTTSITISGKRCLNEKRVVDLAKHRIQPATPWLNPMFWATQPTYLFSVLS